MRVLGQPAPTNTDFLTDLVFGLTWDESTELSVESVSNDAGFNIQKSGQVAINAGLNYQAFFANATPYTFPQDWNHKEWIAIAKVRFDGSPVERSMIKIAESGFHPVTEPNLGVNLKDFGLEINGFATDDEYYFELADFTANANASDVYLHWTSEIEVNSKSFELERSLDGDRWTSIANIEAVTVSNTPVDYSYVDQNASKQLKENQNIYYRLKLIKTDDSYNYSTVRIVRSEPNYFEFSIMPDSANGQTMSVIRSHATNSAQVFVYNYAGMLVKKANMAVSQKQLQLEEIPGGVYIVRIGNVSKKVFLP